MKWLVSVWFGSFVCIYARSVFNLQCCKGSWYFLKVYPISSNLRQICCVHESCHSKTLGSIPKAMLCKNVLPKADWSVRLYLNQISIILIGFGCSIWRFDYLFLFFLHINYLAIRKSSLTWVSVIILYYINSQMQQGHWNIFFSIYKSRKDSCISRKIWLAAYLNCGLIELSTLHVMYNLTSELF